MLSVGLGVGPAELSSVLGSGVGWLVSLGSGVGFGVSVPGLGLGSTVGSGLVSVGGGLVSVGPGSGLGSSSPASPSGPRASEPASIGPNAESPKSPMEKESIANSRQKKIQKFKI